MTQEYTLPELQAFAAEQRTIAEGIADDNKAIAEIVLRIAQPLIDGVQEDRNAIDAMVAQLVSPINDGIKSDRRALTRAIQRAANGLAQGIGRDQAYLRDMLARLAQSGFAGGAQSIYPIKGNPIPSATYQTDTSPRTGTGAVVPTGSGSALPTGTQSGSAPLSYQIGSAPTLGLQPKPLIVSDSTPVAYAYSSPTQPVAPSPPTYPVSPTPVPTPTPAPTPVPSPEPLPEPDLEPTTEPATDTESLCACLIYAGKAIEHGLLQIALALNACCEAIGGSAQRQGKEEQEDWPEWQNPPEEELSELGLDDFVGQHTEIDREESAPQPTVPLNGTLGNVSPNPR